MNESLRTPAPWRGSLLRRAMWGGAAVLLLAPAVAMRFTAEVNWDASDFVFAAVLLALAGGAVEAGMRRSPDPWYRAGVVVAAGGAFVLVWANAAVGLIGGEDTPANLLYPGVVGIALVGAVAACLRPRGMARAMTAALAAHVAIGIAALVAGWGGAAAAAGEVIGVTAVFALPWALAAGLFRMAARTAQAR